jgi:hypothetical protein
MITEMAIEQLDKVLIDFRKEYQCLPLTVGEVLNGLSRQELLKLVVDLMSAAQNVVQSRL